MDIESLIDKLNKISPNDDSLYEVDFLIERLYKLDSSVAKKAITPLFNIFERLNDGHYDDVLWSIIHGIEGLQDYEEDLINSVNRCPNEYNLLMLNRMLNAGQASYNATDFIELLKSVAEDNKVSAELKEQAKGYITRQSKG